MAGITLIAQPVAVATKQFPRAIQAYVVSQCEAHENHTTVHMNWVVVTDRAGRQQLRMQWTRSAAGR
jgi:hypothetical protein